MCPKLPKDLNSDSWPGKSQQQSETSKGKGGASRHWHPTDFGPGMGPDLSSSGKTPTNKANKSPEPESAVERKDSKESRNPDASRNIEDIENNDNNDNNVESAELCSIVHTAEGILKYRVGDQCPNCDFASLKLDADDNVSCPICGFGAHRACG